MTTTAETERALISALDTIRDHWAALGSVNVGGSTAGRTPAKALITHKDDDERTDDLARADVVLDLRREVTLCLNGWCRLIVEENDLTPRIKCDHRLTFTMRWPYVGPTTPQCVTGQKWIAGMHPVLGTDALGMVTLLERWARWFSGHEAGPDAANELRVWAGKVRAMAAPTRREWMALGTCPLEVEEEVPGTGEVATYSRVVGTCGGQVRAYPHREPQCQKCGTEAVVEWWERVMFPDVETSDLVTADELVLVLHKAFGGEPVKPSSLRQWIKRGIIESSGKDDKGRTLYSREAVVWALSRRQEVTH